MRMITAKKEVKIYLMKVRVDLPQINLANGAEEEYPNRATGRANPKGWGSNRLVYVTFGRPIFSVNKRRGLLTDRHNGMYIPEVLLKRVVEEEPAAVAKAA